MTTPRPYPRRVFLRRAGLSALAVSGSASILASCASGGDEEEDEVSGGGQEQTAENPFGVNATDPLYVVIFNGGYGEEYAKYHESIYQEKFSGAEIKHEAITDIRQKMQPKFASSEPPDVLDNAGAEKLPISTLANNGQLTDLTELWDADAIGFEGTTVRDTLHPIAIEAAEYANKPYVMNYALQVYGIWYDRALFDEKGWEPAETWSDFLDLCETIKSAGIAPMAHQGKYPYYIQQVLMDMAVKHGGPEVVYAIDSLEPDAWQHDSMRLAADALLEIKNNGYMLEGTEGLDHIQSQTRWNEGKAAFIPSGSWLENEQAEVVAEVNPDFQTTVAPTPLLDGAVLPFDCTRIEAAEAFIVPTDGANQVGGLEYLRIMLSKDGARKFTELTSAPTVVNGAADGLDASPGLASSLALIDSGGENNWNYYFAIWYSPLDPLIQTVVGELAAGRISADEFCDRAQDAADQIAKDPTTQKRTRS
jgi:N-acetylglucosamine transport system substrate-binding protein